GGVTCDPVPGLGFPAYSTVEDSKIGSAVTISGLHSCWMGFFRNQVAGDVLIQHNTFADPDAPEVTDNLIDGRLGCFDNSPSAHVGDSGGGPNQARGGKFGECASL